MARMTSMDALETKIEKAQEQVSRTKKPYDAYKELNRYMGADNAVTAAMLCFLVSGLVSDAEKGCEPEEL